MGKLFSIFLATFLICGPSIAQEQKEESRYRNVAAMGTPVGREQDTTLMLDQQSRDMQAGQNSLSTAEQLAAGKERAAQMVEMIKSEEMKKALDKVTKRGKEALQEDPSLRTPMGVLAGAISLWFGKSVKMVSGDMTLRGRIEGRARTGEFTMEHPLLNSKLRFSGDSGVDINVNRRISSIDSQAEFNYNLRNQVFSTTIRKRLAPNLDFSFGASQIPQTTTTDGNARIEYHWDF